MMRTLDPGKKKDWKRYISTLVHAFNCTRQSSTGVSPYFLMFGRNPRIPVDLAFGIELDDHHRSMSDYVTYLRDRLSQAYKTATVNSKAMQKSQLQMSQMTVNGEEVLFDIVAEGNPDALVENDPTAEDGTDG